MIRQVAAKLILVDLDNKILLLRRSGTHPRYPHMWDIPGGFVEEAEDTKDAVVRELLEETLIEVDKNTLSLVYAKTDFYENDSIGEEPRSVVRTFFVSSIADKQPQVTISWEHDQFAWVTLPEAIDLLSDTLFFDCITYVSKNHILIA